MMGFPRRRVLEGSVDEAWATRVSFTREFGGNKKREIDCQEKMVDHIAARVDKEGLAQCWSTRRGCREVVFE